MGKRPVWRNPIISEIARHQSFLFFIHVFIMGTSFGLEVWRRSFAPSSHLQGPIQRDGPGSWSYRQVGYCSWRLLKCRGHNGDSMFHWSRLGVPRGRGGVPPFHCARGVCVLPLLIPVSWETGARRTRDWSEGSWTMISEVFHELTEYKILSLINVFWGSRTGTLLSPVSVLNHGI